MAAKKKSDTTHQTSFTGSGMLEVSITCVGTTPLLMNRMTPEVLESIRTGAKRAKSLKGHQTPREEAAPKLYLTGDNGTPYIPTENLLACLIGAGQFVRLDGKRQVSSAKSTTLPAFLSLRDPLVPLFNPADESGILTWEVDIRPGRNPNGGEAVCLCRPRFDRWGFRVNALIDTAEVNPLLVRQIFDIAGKRIGLGDFRPSRKGMFGQFHIVRWDEIESAIAAE